MIEEVSADEVHYTCATGDGAYVRVEADTEDPEDRCVYLCTPSGEGVLLDSVQIRDLINRLNGFLEGSWPNTSAQ